jgi:hypothetical protein
MNQKMNKRAKMTEKTVYNILEFLLDRVGIGQLKFHENNLHF